MDVVGDLVALINGDLDSDTATCRFEPAVVSSTSATAADGQTECTLTWRGATIRAPYLSTYTPTVGDVVVLIVQGRSRFVVGKLKGLNYVQASGGIYGVMGTGSKDGGGNRKKRKTY